MAVSCYLLDVEKGKEIESQFRELYQPTQPAPVLKGRKGRTSKKLPQKEENKELSSYAGNLTKQFLIKMSLLDLSPLLSFSFLGFVSYLYPFFPINALIKCICVISNRCDWASRFISVT